MISVESIRDWLKNLAEDRTMPMDVQVHEAIWQMIQSIDIELGNFPVDSRQENKQVLKEIKEMKEKEESSDEVK